MLKLLSTSTLSPTKGPGFRAECRAGNRARNQAECQAECRAGSQTEKLSRRTGLFLLLMVEAERKMGMGQC